MKKQTNITWESNNVKLLRIAMDIKLKFDEHESNICSKANRKLSDLTRVSKFLLFNKRHILFKAFIDSQFTYCLLVWMFHGKRINDKINRQHERAPKITRALYYNDIIASFEESLAKN